MCITGSSQGSGVNSLKLGCGWTKWGLTLFVMCLLGYMQKYWSAAWTNGTGGVKESRCGAVRAVNSTLWLTGSNLEKRQACKHFAQTTVPTVGLSLPFIGNRQSKWESRWLICYSHTGSSAADFIILISSHKQPLFWDVTWQVIDRFSYLWWEVVVRSRHHTANKIHF